MQRIERLGISFAIRDGELGVWDSSIVDSVFFHDEYNLRDLLRFNPRLIIDVGAHIGSFSRLVQFLFPGCHLIALEPIKDNFDLLLANTIQCSNFLALDKACTGIEVESIRLACNQSNTGSWTLSKNTGTQVKAVTLLKVLQLYNQPVDFLKMDIEGMEVELLRSLVVAGWLRKVNHIRGEWHGSYAKNQIPVLLGNTHYVELTESLPSLGHFVARRK